MTFGEKVKKLRKNKGLNQTQLADAVNLNGKQKDALKSFEQLLSDEQNYEKRKGFFDRLKDFMK